MANLIAKKTWRNAAAFIKVDEQGNCSVYGKFYDDNRGHFGPATGTLKTLSPELFEEAQTLNFLSPRSPELEKVVQEIWELAKKEEPWFSYL